MVLGVKIPEKGNHDIIFKYEIPFLNVGTLLSLISIISAYVILALSSKAFTYLFG